MLLGSPPASCRGLHCQLAPPLGLLPRYPHACQVPATPLYTAVKTYTKIFFLGSNVHFFAHKIVVFIREKLG